MELPQHGRYDYSPIVERPDYSWPDGKRLAFFFAVNIEHFAFGEGRGHTPTAPGAEPDQRNYAWRDYGLRVGIWRIFEMMDELGIPACHLLNTTVFDMRRRSSRSAWRAVIRSSVMAAPIPKRKATTTRRVRLR
ncbi:MAG: hypothetical protein OXR03_04530 [Rhodospirillaceae bacterium]|nr:hypothetical protein [Rhodospirillaceae bacterium]